MVSVNLGFVVDRLLWMAVPGFFSHDVYWQDPRNAINIGDNVLAYTSQSRIFAQKYHNGFEMKIHSFLKRQVRPRDSPPFIFKYNPNNSSTSLVAYVLSRRLCIWDPVTRAKLRQIRLPGTILHDD